MTNIMIYDMDAERIEKIVDEKDLTTAELIACLLDLIEDGDIEI